MVEVKCIHLVIDGKRSYPPGTRTTAFSPEQAQTLVAAGAVEVLSATAEIDPETGAGQPEVTGEGAGSETGDAGEQAGPTDTAAPEANLSDLIAPAPAPARTSGKKR